MPPKVNSKVKEVKKCKTYPTENMDNAIKAVEEGMLMTKACNHFNVPKGTYNRLNNKFPGLHGRPTALSQEEEKLLVERILICADGGYPLDRIEWTIPKNRAKGKKRRNIESEPETSSSDSETALATRVAITKKKQEKKFNPQVSSFVLIRVPTTTGSAKIHLGMVTSVKPSGDSVTYGINYLASVPGSGNEKFYMVSSDLDKIEKDDMVPENLLQPVLNARAQYLFPKSIGVSGH